MNTSEINAQRLDTIRGPVATELVTVARNHLHRRMVAIGAGTGRGFVVTTGGIATTQAPVDFTEAVAEVDSRPVQAWPPAVHDDLSDLSNEEFIAYLGTGYFDDWLSDFRRHSIEPAENRPDYVGM